MATLEQQVKDQQRTDVRRLLQLEMQERHQMEKQHASKLSEFERKSLGMLHAAILKMYFDENLMR